MKINDYLHAIEQALHAGAITQDQVKILIRALPWSISAETYFSMVNDVYDRKPKRNTA